MESSAYVAQRRVDLNARNLQAFGLTGTVAMLDGGHSFYARFGPIFAWLNLLATVALLVVRAKAQGSMPGAGKSGRMLAA